MNDTVDSVVAQEDREATEALPYRRGDVSLEECHQAFARHRLTAERKHEAEVERLREALEGVATSLEVELNRADILRLFETEIEPEDELVAWLGEDMGREMIAAVIRLRKARQALGESQ